MKTSICLISLLFAGTALADNALSIHHANVLVPEVWVNSVTPIEYVLTNNSTKPISFQVNSEPSTFKLDRQYSTCRDELAAHQSCQLRLKFIAPNIPVIAKTVLTVTPKNSAAMTKQFYYHVQDKEKTLLSNGTSIDWQEITSLTGGNISSVTPSTTNPNVLYATAGNGDIYQSSNGGSHWSLLTNYFNHRGAELFGKNSVLFCLTFDDGVFKSFDAGTTWQDFSEGLNINPDFGGFTVMNGLVERNNVLYVAPTTGVFMRGAADKSWTSLNPPRTLFADTLMVANNTLYAGNYGPGPTVAGVYALPNGSTNWIPLGLNGLNVQTLFNDVDNGIIYAGINNFANSPQAIFKSSDEGKTWMNTTNQMGYSRVLQLTKFNHAIYAATLSGGGVFKSTDNGANWQSINNGVPYLDTQNIVAIGKNLFLSTVGGLYKSIDGGDNWVSANQGILERQVRSINVLDNSSLFISTISGDLFKSQDNGQTWNAQNNGLNINDNAGFMEKTVIKTSEGVLYLAQFENVYKSTDNGESWININNNINGWGEHTLGLIASDNGVLYLAGFDTVYVSKDGGDNWAPISPDRLTDDIEHMTISHHEIYISLDGNIYKNALDGKTGWQLINHNLPSPNPHGLEIYGMVSLIDNDNNPRVYLATNAGVYFSKDGGKNWLTANNTLPQGVVVTSIIARGTHLIIGTANQGLYYSTDAGLTWQSAGSLPVAGAISHLGANNNDVFASASRGLFKINVQEVGF